MRNSRRGRVGVACFLWGQDVESLRHDNLHFLFRVRAASFQSNGQSGTVHEAEMIKKKEKEAAVGVVCGLKYCADYVGSHSLYDPHPT